jgi:hypothetical protein
MPCRNNKNGSECASRKPEPLGDRDENVLYAAVGRALSQWETVESACARIYAFLIGTPTDELTISPALHSFGIVNSFPTRCEMISTAGKAYFHLHPEVANYEKQINEALSEAKGFSNRRNEIAHGVVRPHAARLGLPGFGRVVPLDAAESAAAVRSATTLRSLSRTLGSVVCSAALAHCLA